MTPVSWSGAREITQAIGHPVISGIMESDGPFESRRSPQVSALLVAQLAHDLRMLLAVMVHCVDSLRARVPADDDSDRTFAELDGAIDGAFSVARELLALAGPQPGGRGVIDVNELVAQARGVLERILGGTIRVSFDLAAPAPFVEADAVLLEWVLLNLAANAADAMPAGGLLSVETAVVDTALLAGDASARGSRRVRLTVKDTGSGMSAPVRDQSLEPFFTTRPGRTGLGLTSASITVARLGGALNVGENTPSGTRVDIYLPVLEARRRR